MNHSFNTEIATKYGVSEAIVLENLYFWITKNKANKTHFYDGYYWTYNSTRALKILFPYWSVGQIERIVKSLRDEGLIMIGNYNKTGCDRTRWFTLTLACMNIFPFQQMQTPKTTNANTENDEPIPDINTVVNTDKEYIVEIIDYLNSKANTKYKSTSTKTQTLIKTRLSEGFTLEDFKTAITNKVAEWKGTEWEKFLRPDTLFSNKFEGYVNQKINKATKEKVDKFNSYPQREYDFKNLENNLLGYGKEEKE